MAHQAAELPLSRLPLAVENAALGSGYHGWYEWAGRPGVALGAVLRSGPHFPLIPLRMEHLTFRWAPRAVDLQRFACAQSADERAYLNRTAPSRAWDAVVIRAAHGALPHRAPPTIDVHSCRWRSWWSALVVTT